MPPPPEIVQFLAQKYRKPQVDPVGLDFIFQMASYLVQRAGLAQRVL